MFRSSSVGQRPTSSVPPGTRSQLQNGAVQRGLGALPSTSKMDASPGGGASIFGMMGPSCPACHVCRTEMGTQPDSSPATRFRGSGGPLPPFRCGLEPQKDDPMPKLTPMCVFFLVCSALFDRNFTLCQQLHGVQKSYKNTASFFGKRCFA